MAKSYFRILDYIWHNVKLPIEIFIRKAAMFVVDFYLDHYPTVKARLIER